jgi:hypothetical protein
MAKICFVGLPGKIGRCIITGPQPPPVHPQKTSGIEEPGIYPEIFVDASIIDTVHHATKNISDRGTRAALQKGIEDAVAAMKKRGGEDIFSITLDG